MAINNDEYKDEYKNEYFCRVSFVVFTFLSMISSTRVTIPDINGMVRANIPPHVPRTPCSPDPMFPGPYVPPHIKPKNTYLGY